jgi:hypothetical protein
MPINRMLQGNAFDADLCQAMGCAYDAILQELNLTDRNDPVCEIIAEKVIELCQRGERDPQRLHDGALAGTGFKAFARYPIDGQTAPKP